ncbi:MAG: S8 family peptidase [Thermomicrobiales bacterium]
MIRVRLRVTAFIVLMLVCGLLFPIGVLANAALPTTHVIGALDPFARDHVPGSLLVTLNNATAPVIRLNSLDTLTHFTVADAYEERTSPTEERETYARLLADPRVASVEPNYRVHAMQVPNDPIYAREYWTRSVNLEPAWDITTGSSNVTVAVLDSGVYLDHPDLRGRIVPGFNSIDNSTNVNDDTDIQHGTKVSLLVGARGNDGIGQAGVAWNIKLMPVKVIDKGGTGDARAVANGIAWATDHGATVINLSIGGTDFSNTLARTIGYARSKNVTVVTAAGNDPYERDFPADDMNVITVGASNENNDPASFTSTVNKVDVAAPGVNLPFLLPEVSNDIATDSGTSFSAPIVSGIIALMQSVRPGLRQEEALAILKTTARDIGPPGPDKQSGAGLVDAVKAVRAAQATAPPTQQSGPPPYAATYNRYDSPVLSGAAKRGFIWGPRVNTSRLEPYSNAPAELRQVWYFDKGRLELNDPQTGQITSGLLVNELVTGQVQTGDSTRETRAPAAVAVAGDPGVPGAITYATMNGVRAAPPRAIGSPITEQLHPDGSFGTATSGDATGVTTTTFIKETNHTVASVFWQYLNSTGITIQNGQSMSGPLFDPTFFVVGLPITEAYWMTATVGGVAKTVLVQAFERRVLTYTPSNPDPFKVEMGNVGQHYVAWRYGQ